MHNFLLFDDEVLPVKAACLPAASTAALYGRGIFTTIALSRSRPFLWEKHWQRLKGHAERLQIDLEGFFDESVLRALAEIVKTNGVETGRARVTLFDVSPGGIWPSESDSRMHLLITTADLRPLRPPLNLTVSPFRVNSTSPLAGLKSCNYLDNLLALEDARKRGFDEAVRLNERDEVVSACLANIFWVRGGDVFTPALSTGCLAGTTREFLRENFDIRETVAPLEELLEADEIFLSSAGFGVCPAACEVSRRGPDSISAEMKRVLDLHIART